jgi:hypothetical protein
MADLAGMAGFEPKIVKLMGEDWDFADVGDKGASKVRASLLNKVEQEKIK